MAASLLEGSDGAVMRREDGVCGAMQQLTICQIRHRTRRGTKSPPHPPRREKWHVCVRQATIGRNAGVYFANIGSDDKEVRRPVFQAIKTGER